MKQAFIILFFIASVLCSAQDTLLLSSYPLIDKEMSCCKGAKNQLHCLDSLIHVNTEIPKVSGKVNYPKLYSDRYRKLIVYTYNAGFVSGRRGNLEQALDYFGLTEKYLDTLNQNDKDKGNGFEDFHKAIYYQRIELCSETYYKDTARFFRCDCDQYFPEFSEEVEEAETVDTSKQQVVPIRTEWNLFGQFYLNDTLRFDNRFSCDSADIVYFNRMKSSILYQLQQRPLYAESHIKPDTLIIKVSLTSTPSSYERKCEIVRPPSYQGFANHYLLLFGQMSLPLYKDSVSFYVPLIITPELPNNYNKMTQTRMEDHHFLIEYEQIRPIKLH